MTLEEVRAMTPKEKRAKLAELLGWRSHECGDPKCWINRSNVDLPVTGYFEDVVPDYCNDLNAVHEVEVQRSLSEYADVLRIVVAHDNQVQPAHLCDGYLVMATADQRTTALILTLSTQR